MATRVNRSRVCCRLRSRRPGAPVVAADFVFDNLGLADLRAINRILSIFTSCKFALSAQLGRAAGVRNRFETLIRALEI